MRNVIKYVVAGALLVGSPFAIAEDPATPAAPTTAKAEPVDFRKLKELLPQTVLGLKRENADGQKMKMNDVSFSQASASYRNEQAENDETDTKPSVSIDITDYGNVSGMAAGMAAWSQFEVDNESDTGYEKTHKLADQPAHETYNSQDKFGQINIYVANRFIVGISASNVTADDMKKLREALDLKKLAQLK